MKSAKVVFVVILTLFIASCQNVEDAINKTQGQGNVPDYTPSSEDVVSTHGDIENIQRFKEFLQNVEEEQQDSIRVVRYTTEGDPMLQDLEYDGEVIKSTRDTRRDEYGNGSLHTTTCSSIAMNESPERTDYVLQGCDNIRDNIVLVIWK